MTMSKILSYSDNTTGTGWIAKDPYSGDDIEKITDPNGDTVEHPRTSIPSPFARVDLVSTAFSTLAANALNGAAMHHRLVSDSLDVAQLLFNYNDFSGEVRLVRWHPARHLGQMRGAGGAHTLLADTLELFMDSDRDAYNFDAEDSWYILTYRNRAIGATSPATFTMSAPYDTPLDDILIEEGIPMFDTEPRHLWQRDSDFILYLIHWFNAYPEARRKLKSVYDYILTNLEVLRTKRPEVYRRITERVENPHALRTDIAESLAASLESHYTPFRLDISPRVLGYPLYMQSKEDTLRGPKQSDFMLKPVLTQEEGETLPLILHQGFVSPGSQPYIYINKPWRDATKVDTAGLPPERRILPDTSVAYPWLTDSDLLEDKIIELATPIDSAHFFNGNHEASRSETHNGYLLPLTPLFFKYFPASFIAGSVAPGRKTIEIRDEHDAVTVILRIPVRKGYVELNRRYKRSQGDYTDTSTGLIVPEVRLSAGVFPFVRTGIADMYNIRLFEMIPESRASLQFYADGSLNPLSAGEAEQRTTGRAMRTSYYELDHTWDYARVQIESDNGQSSVSGVMLPLWQEYNAGNQHHVFAVDFGTTNSHVEYSVDDSPARPLRFSASSVATLVATLDAEGSLAQADTLLDVEFIPRSIDDTYGFPMRTALASNVTGKSAPRALSSVNIPFLYERKPFSGYKIHTMLKWSSDTELSEQYLRELMLLIRARVLLDNASPSATRIIYFYPVSMSRSLQNRYMTLWENLYMRYLDPTKTDVVAYPESVAPAFHYNDSSTAGTDYVSIDIGGGSSDVVIYRADDEQLSSDPAVIASFRFAGDAIFGDAFAEADFDNNRMLRHYVDYFCRRLSADRRFSYIEAILTDIAAAKRSRDISACLFSVENAPGLRSLPPLDRIPYSFNTLLRDDSRLKLIFVYFHTAIIYYVAHLMQNAGLGMPRRVCFSGTGSKILNILGRPELVCDYTAHIFEDIFGERYTSEAPFGLNIERDASKQVTCKGGIALERELRTGHADSSIFTPRHIMECKETYTLTPDGPYTNAGLRSRQARASIEDAVRRFNSRFEEILSVSWREEFGISREAMEIFRSQANRDIAAYLTSAVNTLVPRDAAPDETIEDIPFFYPIIGIIRNTLIPALSDLKE